MRVQESVRSVFYSIIRKSLYNAGRKSVHGGIHSKNNRSHWCSNDGWEAAAQLAVDEAKKTLHGIHGLKVMDMTAEVDGSGKISRYKTTVKLSFGVER